MKTHIKIWALLLVLALLVGCRTTKKNLPFELVEPKNLTPSLNQAIMTSRAIEKGNQSSLPFVSIDANAIIDVDKISPYAVKKRVLHIGNYLTNPEGAMKLDFTTESKDSYGRIDYRLINMTYKTVKPNKTQVKNIKTWLLKQYSSSSGKANNISRNDWKDFQKETGLTTDGLFGPASATALAQGFSMIHVQSLKNKIIYPKTPNHMLFILPYKVFMQKKAKLSKGFKSWVEVSKLGISKDEFKQTAKKGKRYVLFVYFLDRVDPAFGISAHFASGAKSKGGSGENKKYYTKPGTWPIIVRSFNIDEVPDKLYVNIFIKERGMNSPCVGSHRLL